MVALSTVRRVLALDLGMTPSAIARHLDDLGLPGDAGADGADCPEVPLPEALRIVAVAEARAELSR